MTYSHAILHVNETNMPSENSNAILYRIRVAIPVYVYDTFDYTVSAEQYQQAQIGARVAVSFGQIGRAHV